MECLANQSDFLWLIGEDSNAKEIGDGIKLDPSPVRTSSVNPQHIGLIS
jgi:hypothetical protein